MCGFHAAAHWSNCAFASIIITQRRKMPGSHTNGRSRLLVLRRTNYLELSRFARAREKMMLIIKQQQQQQQAQGIQHDETSVSHSYYGIWKFGNKNITWAWHRPCTYAHSQGNRSNAHGKRDTGCDRELAESSNYGNMLFVYEWEMDPLTEPTHFCHINIDHVNISAPHLVHYTRRSRSKSQYFIG